MDKNTAKPKPTRPGMSRRQSMIATAAGLTALSGVAQGFQPLRPRVSTNYKFSLAAYSYRNLLQGKSAKMTMFDFIDECAMLGLEGTELTSYYFEEPVTDDYLRKLKHHCFRNGVDISGTAIRCDFGVPPGAKRDEEIVNVKRWIQRAEVLGAPVIRIFAGHVPQGQSIARTHELIVAGIQECCDFASRHGVHLALENHGGPTSTSEGLLKIVKDVNSQWFGVNLDTGNFHSKDVYAELAEAAPHAINVQVKVVTSGPDKVKKPADFGRIARILEDANYRGYVVLEYEEDGDVRKESARYLKELREAFC